MSVIDDIYKKQPVYAAAEATPTGTVAAGAVAAGTGRNGNDAAIMQSLQNAGVVKGGGSEPVIKEPTMNMEYVPGRFYKAFEDSDPYKQRLGDIGKELKRAKRQRSFAQLADGLSAFHRAYAHARGIQPMTLERNLTGKTRERYETLAKERDALQAAQLSGRMKAQQMDMEEAWKNRNWERTLKLDRKADEDREYKRKKADEAFEYQKNRDKVKDTQWQQQLEATKKQHAATLAAQERRYQESIRRENSRLRGKPLQFSAGGNTFTIYQNVWSKSWPVLYEHLIKKVDANEARRLQKASTSEKERFVESYWSNDPEAIEMMRSWSHIDPAGEYSTPASGSENGGGLGWGQNGEINGLDW